MDLIATLGIPITFILMLVLLFAGMPIAISLIVTGIIGIVWFQGLEGVLPLGFLIWDAVFKWSLLAIVGFVFMGNLFFEHGFGADLFSATNKWLGRLPGGLAIAATAMAALFGFICGSAMAGIATIAGISIPEMEKRGYDRKISLGALSIAGSLSALIPPSVLMIIYAVLAEVSLGHLFIAGIIPGFVLAGLISMHIFTRAVVNPALCPKAPRSSWQDKLSSTKGLLPVALTFVIVLGGIYMGIWSAIEASAAGAVLAFLITLAYRRLSAAKLRKSLYETVRICCMIYAIILGAAFLNHFIFVSGFNDILVNLVTGLVLPGWMVVVLILLIITIMGCFLDAYAMMIISISVFLPIITNLGYDPVWFGVILIIEVELALITPPVGLNLFILRGMAPEGTKMGDIIAGALPYVIVVWVLFALMIAFPEMALWLPGTIK